MEGIKFQFQAPSHQYSNSHAALPPAAPIFSLQVWQVMLCVTATCWLVAIQEGFVLWLASLLFSLVSSEAQQMVAGTLSSPHNSTFGITA